MGEYKLHDRRSPHTAMSALRGVGQRMLFGIFMGFAVFLMHSILGAIHWWTMTGYAVIGIAIAFIGWGAERLWYKTVGGMLKNPDGVLAYCSRIPFWYLAGGIGYEVGMLTAKKLFLMGFYDIPVQPLFVFGAKLNVILQFFIQPALYLWRKIPNRMTLPDSR